MIGNDGFIYIINALSDNKILTELSVWCNKQKISPQHNDAFSTLFNFAANEIYDEGFTAVAESLTYNETLKKIDLGYNNLSDVSASKIAEIIRTNSSLTSLDISCKKKTYNSNEKLTNDAYFLVL